MTLPATTIIVLQREGFTATAERLDAILATAGVPAHVIFVDGGSPPSCREWLDAAAPRLDMTVLRTPHYLSPAEGRALALPFVHTEYVAFVDNDVRMSDGWLAALERTARDTGAWLVGPLYLHGYPSGSFEQPRIHMAGGRCELVDTDDGRRIVISMDRYDEPAIDAAPSERFATQLLEYHCALARTDVMHRDGMHDAELHTGHDMYDLCLRVTAAGGAIWIEPAAWVFYERPERIAPEDADLFALRWCEEWDRKTLDRFTASWGLEAGYRNNFETRFWHQYHRRLAYVPAPTLRDRVRRKRRYLADSAVQAAALARDAERRRRGGMAVAHAASWFEASPELTPVE